VALPVTLKLVPSNVKFDSPLMLEALPVAVIILLSALLEILMVSEYPLFPLYSIAFLVLLKNTEPVGALAGTESTTGTVNVLFTSTFVPSTAINRALPL